MIKRAVILSGGGSNGAFQAGALRALDHAGIGDFSVVFGNSVGALNGCLANNTDALLHLWYHELAGNPGRVFRPLFTDYEMKFRLGRAVRSMPYFLKNGIHALSDNTPLKCLIDEYVSTAKLPAVMVAGAVDLEDGQYISHNLAELKENGLFQQWVLASASMPPFLPPVEIGGRLYADGGLSSVLPIQAFFASEWASRVQEIWVITCRTEKTRNRFLGNHLPGYWMTANQIMQTKIYQNEVSAKPKTSQRIRWIEPDGDYVLPDTFDFGKDAIRKLYLHAIEKTKNVLKTN